MGRFGAHVTTALRRREPRGGRSCHRDEVFVRIGGEQEHLWRMVDEHGRVLDVLLQERRDTGAAERFFRTLLGDAGGPPERIVADRLGSYSRRLRFSPRQNPGGNFRAGVDAQLV